MNTPDNVVYDCMVFLQAAAKPGRVHGTMRLVQEGHVTLCLSPTVIAEVRDVLTRPELLAKFPALKAEYVDTFLNDLLSRARIVNNVPAVFSLPRDKKDEPYLDLAIEAKARYLVTWNDRHLTYLMRRDTPEGKDFCSRFPDITILDPPAFVRAVQKTREPNRESAH